MRAHDCSNREFYDQRWRDAFKKQDLPIDERRAATIMSLISRWMAPAAEDRGCRIIDIGCGVGWLSHRLVRVGKVTGVDSSKTAIEIARSNYGGVDFACSDILDDREVRKLGLFDLAVCSEVIEHIPGIAKLRFAEALAQLVRPGGILIITTPNRCVWKHYWKGPDSVKWKQPVEEWVSPRELIGLLEKVFRLLEMATFNFSFSRRGIYRLLNSVRVNSLARKCLVACWLNKVKEHRYGLYIGAAFRRV